MRNYSVTTNSELRELCIKNNWFTSGSVIQYEKMFCANEQGWPLEEIALMIWLCSNEKWTRQDITTELRLARGKYIENFMY